MKGSPFGQHGFLPGQSIVKVQNELGRAYITDQDNVLETRTIDGRLIEIENRFQLSNVISIVYS